MRELIYLHFSASHIASHFFNTQESYFTYDDQDDEVLADHDVSFREGLASDGSPTFYPRVLLFDDKANFGSLSSIQVENKEQTSTQTTWSGPVVEHRQEPIPQSSYHARLDAGEDGDEELKDPTYDPTPSVRFWSDYSRVFYHPRSLHRIPDRAEWEHNVGWTRGIERYALYDTEHSVIEESFRLFAEECDLLQGLQLTLDASSFGSFAVSFLSQLRDDYPKLPLLSFCSLSAHDPATIDLEDIQPCMSSLNDALTMHELASLSTLTVPLQHPATWRRGPWSTHLDGNFTNVYHTSAILATHLESATLPLRLKSGLSSSTDLATLCSHLNWRGDTPLAAMFGALPMPAHMNLESFTFDYSHPPSLHQKAKNATSFAQRDIFRGLKQEKESVQKRVQDVMLPRLREPLLSTSYIDLAYPIPSSYPQFFTRLDATGRNTPSSTQVRVRSVPLYTSLRTTPRTGILAASYGRLIERLRNRPGIVNGLGIEKEQVGELIEGLWNWVDAYGEDSEEENEDEQWGEDERDVG